MVRARLMAVVLACLGVFPALAETDLLGQIDFPTSGTPEAQAEFIEGMLYMHNFEYAEASEAFKRAQETDPDYAMAYWGEAMALNHPLWHNQARDEARETLRHLGRTPEERAAKAPTQREKDYLGAMEILYGNTKETKELPKPQRDILYRDAMKRLHEAYPDDHEATTLYGLSILGVGSEKRDYATYMKAAAVLTEVWDANRQHPGAAHYLIHSYDDPVHAPLGLPMARAYSKIAPAAAHAQHMTSHIFVAMGMWDDLVAANTRAVEVEFDVATPEETESLPPTHYTYWLEYGYLQQGRLKDARTLLRTVRTRFDEPRKAGERAYYGTMAGRYLLDTQDYASVATWAAPEGVDVPSANYHFALAVAALKNGQPDAAREHAARVAFTEKSSPEVTPDEDTVLVLRKELEALFALAEGKGQEALEFARDAVTLETGLIFSFGPPHVAKPSAELLGEMLFDAGQAGDAVAAFQDQLSRTPRRALSLLGLARAAKAAGNESVSADAYRELANVWQHADEDLLAYDEVMTSAKAG